MWASLYHDTTSRLPDLQAPTLILHGDLDRLCPPGNADLLASLPDAALIAFRWGFTPDALRRIHSIPNGHAARRTRSSPPLETRRVRTECGCG